MSMCILWEKQDFYCLTINPDVLIECSDIHFSYNTQVNLETRCKIVYQVRVRALSFFDTLTHSSTPIRKKKDTALPCVEVF